MPGGPNPLGATTGRAHGMQCIGRWAPCELFSSEAGLRVYHSQGAGNDLATCDNLAGLHLLPGGGVCRHVPCCER